MKQQTFLSRTRKEHGGAFSFKTRRSKRPMSLKQPLHFTLRSDFAYGQRSLLKHRALILHIGKKFSRQFGVRIYRQAICGNHLHLLILGTSREGLQNFFRVFAGHIAQQITRTAPITDSERRKVRGGALITNGRSSPGCAKNQRKFWALLAYTRVVTWGREFRTVSRYILQNTLEALKLIAYQPRGLWRKTSRNDGPGGAPISTEYSRSKWGFSSA